MSIENDDLRRFAVRELEAIGLAELPTHVEACPHCGYQVRHPVVVRESDLRDFEVLLAATHKVLERNGVNALLLAEIHTEIAVSRASASQEGV